MTSVPVLKLSMRGYQREGGSGCQREVREREVEATAIRNAVDIFYDINMHLFIRFAARGRVAQGS